MCQCFISKEQCFSLKGYYDYFVENEELICRCEKSSLNLYQLTLWGVVSLWTYKSSQFLLPRDTVLVLSMWAWSQRFFCFLQHNHKLLTRLVQPWCFQFKIVITLLGIFYSCPIFKSHRTKFSKQNMDHCTINLRCLSK